MREAAKLERDATKRKMQQMKEDIIAQKNSEAIEHKAKRVLEMQDRILSRKKIKYKDKEEETLGKLAEDLAQTVRAAKERLEKLEKEDAALKKKEEAFNKKKKVGVDEAVPEDDAASATTKPDKPTYVRGLLSRCYGCSLTHCDDVYSLLGHFPAVLETLPPTTLAICSLCGIA
jgi:bromodomain adjacent to zinc finger domain protein 1A